MKPSRAPSLELLQSNTSPSVMLGDRLTDTENASTLMTLNIIEVINNAKCLNDLHQILIALNPLQQLKQLLQNEVNRIKHNTLSLHKLYFSIMPIDEIFSEDIICSIVHYLSGMRPSSHSDSQYILLCSSTLFCRFQHVQ